MSAKVDRAVREADDYLMDACEPRYMTPREAVEFLELVIERCKSAIDALNEENDL